jgi:Tol biopolymer transport system component
MYGAAANVLDDVREAAWAPDGADLAVLRRIGGRDRLEFPQGRVLAESGGYLSDLRFSPDSKRLLVCGYAAGGFYAYGYQVMRSQLFLAEPSP